MVEIIDLDTHGNNHPVMMCGHAANAKTQDGKPVCAICALLDPGAYVVNDNQPNLTGRLMRCSYAKRPGEEEEHRGGGQYKNQMFKSTRPSDPNRGAFFAYKPDKDYDEFYCGCWGWD